MHFVWCVEVNRLMERSMGMPDAKLKLLSDSQLDCVAANEVQSYVLHMLPRSRIEA